MNCFHQSANTPLNDKFTGVDGFSSKSNMDPDKVVAAAIKAMEHNTLEIYLGFANVIKIMSRIAPKFLLGQTGKVGAEIMQ